MGGWNFELPGIHMDEVNHAAFGVGILDKDTVRLHHYRLPDNYFDSIDQVYQYPILGGSFYNSVITAYLGLPIYKVFGFSFESLRLFHAGLGFLCVVLGAFLIARAVGYPAAYIFAVLVTTNPDFIFSLRSQGAIFWPVVFFTLAAVFAFVRAAATPISYRRKWLIFCAGLCLGWSVASYFVGAFVVFPVLIFAWLKLDRSFEYFSPLLIGLFIGYLPVIYAVTSVYLANPMSLSTYGMPEFALRDKTALLSIDNLVRMKNLFLSSLSKFSLTKSVVGQFSISASWLRTFSFSALALLSLWTVLRTDNTDKVTRTIYLTLVILLTFVIGAFFLKGMHAHHMLPLYFVLAIQASLLICLPGITRYLSAIMVGILLFGNVYALNLSHSSLENTAGRKYHNENYAAVARILKEECAECHPVFTLWGHHLSYLFLTKGIKEYTYLPSAETSKLKTLLYQYGHIAIITDAKTFKSMEFNRNDMDLSRTLYMRQRNGTPQYEIHILKISQRKLDLISSASLEVTDWGPKSTSLGVVPNLQPDGVGGIWVLANIDPDFGQLELLIDGKPAVFTQFSNGVITAPANAENFSTLRKMEISIRQNFTGRIFPIGALSVIEQ